MGHALHGQGLAQDGKGARLPADLAEGAHRAITLAQSGEDFVERGRAQHRAGPPVELLRRGRADALLGSRGQRAKASPEQPEQPEQREQRAPAAFLAAFFAAWSKPEPSPPSSEP
jgi:hypothetical protein